MRRRVRALVVPAVVLGALLVAALHGCAISPADQETIRRTWAERDADPYLKKWFHLNLIYETIDDY